MSSICIRCQAQFEVTKEDKVFLEKLSPVIAGKTEALPDPTHCPSCRQQRRLAHGNQLHLYKRVCNFSGKPIISNYHPDAPYPVYNLEAWWSDAWDAQAYARDFDFSRSFFDQYKDLLLVVPRFALHTTYEFDVNSEYVNYSTKNKNCYLIFDSDLNENCYYGYSVNTSKDSMDCYRIEKCELLYECIDCTKCYHCAYLQNCDNCSDSYFLKNCIGCRNCLFSSNLQDKEYFVRNVKVTKEEFESELKKLQTREGLNEAAQFFQDYALQFPQKYLHGIQNEDVSGDYLTHCKNAHECYDSRDLWDCRYNYQGWMKTKDAMDVHQVGDCEIAFESAFAGSNAQSYYFTSHCFESNNLFYCSFCPNSQNLFGCVSMKKAKYCILNKQYTKEEYEALVPKIIAHMRKTGEWGEFFPISLSSFCYNETIAEHNYPLSKDEALKAGYQWRDDDQRTMQTPTATVPDTAESIPDTFTQEILQCAQCEKNYRIMSSELAFHKQMNLPLSPLCFFCRHRARLAKRNKPELFDNQCSKCKKEIRTTYASDRPEIVCCEDCYLQSLQ